MSEKAIRLDPISAREPDDQQKSHPSTSPSAGPSSVSRILVRKRKRDETALTSESNQPRTFQRSLLTQRDAASFHQSERAIEQQDSSNDASENQSTLWPPELGKHNAMIQSSTKSLCTASTIPSDCDSESSGVSTLSLRQNQDYGATMTGAHEGINLYPKPVPPSISDGRESGQHEKSISEQVQDVPYQKSVLKDKLPSNQQPDPPSGGSQQREIAEPAPLQQVIQLSEIKDWSNHLSRGGSAVDDTGNGDLTENRNRPRTLKLSKCSPPRKERNLRPPTPPLRLSSPTIMQDFTIPFMETDDAKDIKFQEQFPPGFENRALKYQLLAYQSEYHRRREKARMDNPSSTHQSSSSQEQYHSEAQQFIGESSTGSMTKDIEATLQAIERKGALSHTVVHGVFVGPARSGKNSLMENLLGRILPSKTPSTGVAEAVVQVQVEKLTTVAATVDRGSIWSKIDDNDEVIRLISIHSDPRNIRFESQANLKLIHEGCVHDAPLNFMTKKHHSDTPLEILTGAIENKGLDALQKYFDTSWSLYLSNTGGQIEFQEILPLLVSGPCMFFYTFRLDRDLNEHYTIEYELSDGTKSELYKSTLTTVEGIQQSLASIAAMGIFVYQGHEKKRVQLRPKVFFVGTHRDQLHSDLAESIIAEKDQYLQDSTRQFIDIIEFASSFQMIFAVNNFSDDKSAFQMIRSAVDRAVERHEFEMVCPSHWLILSFALRRFNQEVVSYEECFEVAKQCGIIDEKELNDALHFIHTKMGLIRYFPHEYIKDIVVVKPQLLYDKISELIVKTFTFDKAGKQSAEQFIQKGIFSLDEFERICRKSGEGSMKAPQFAKLLETLRITAPLETDGDKVTKYFIPCVLAHADKANEAIESLSTEIPPLIVTFKCGYCPKGLGGALISYLMGNKHSDLEWKLLTNCIFRDQVTFEVGPLDTVVLKITSSHLIIACVPNSEIRQRRECRIEKICVTVRKVVEAGIKQVIADTDFIDSEVTHSLTFLCPCDKCLGRYPAEVKNYDGKLYCLRCTRTRVCLELPQGYEKWFSAKSQGQSATIKEHYLTHNDLNTILSSLVKHAAQWREIGAGLKFTEYELDNVENMPFLLTSAPTSWLRMMLSKWLQWAPGDNRGSTSFATLEALTAALNKAGLAATAHDLYKSFEHKLAVHVRSQ